MYFHSMNNIMKINLLLYTQLSKVEKEKNIQKTNATMKVLEKEYRKKK